MSLGSSIIITGVVVDKGINAAKNARVQTPNAGKPFDPNGPSVQIGVDPNTVNIQRPISPEKLKAIYKEARVNGGINRPVEVMRNGNIIDGNHRTIYARETGSSIDIYVK